MELILYRTRIHPETTDGYIKIDGKRVCDTAEHTPVMLQKGCYSLTRKCLYITFGNGVYKLMAPNIIVGEHRCRGLVVNSYSTYRRIRDRLN